MALTHLQPRITLFYKCAGCLMTRHIQSLTISSLASFTELFVQPPYSVRQYGHSGLILRILLDGKTLKYEPDFDEFEVGLRLMLYCISPCPCTRRIIVLPFLRVAMAEWSKTLASLFRVRSHDSRCSSPATEHIGIVVKDGFGQGPQHPYLKCLG